MLLEKMAHNYPTEMVKKCYIERVIYNEFYKYFLHYQNLGHLRELRETEDYYFEYFPNEEINIKINYDNKFYPYQLILTTIKPKEIITETYTKDSDQVICEMNINILGKLVYYSKINTFEKNNEWEPVNTAFGKNSFQKWLFINKFITKSGKITTKGYYLYNIIHSR